jgi:hypothetical protein
LLLTLDGYPTSPADYAHGQWCSLSKNEIRPNIKNLRKYSLQNSGNSSTRVIGDSRFPLNGIPIELNFQGGKLGSQDLPIQIPFIPVLRFPR